MKIKIYSRQKAEELLKTDFPMNTAVISFYDPPSPFHDNTYAPVNYSGKANRIFQIAIHDIDLTILPEYNMTYDTYFPEADNLAEFIYAAKKEGLDITHTSHTEKC